MAAMLFHRLLQRRSLTPDRISSLCSAAQILPSGILRATRQRNSANWAVGEVADAWKASSKTGKSTVTQELWRRREADSSGVGSAHAVAYRFATSLALRDEYVGNSGKVLVGRLLEDFDALAGNVAFDWCSDTLDVNGKPPLLVTAAVDRISISRPLLVTEDLFLTGRVIWTGNSSMLVRMSMRAGRRPSVGELLSEADFVYVAVDRATNRTAKVHQFVPETSEDKELFVHGANAAEAQKQRRKQVNTFKPADAATIKAMVNEGDALAELPHLGRDSNKMLICRTGLESTILSKPQDLNTAGNVFGGMLMRCCYELAFSTCFAFSGRAPKFKEIMEFVFERPVPGGSLLRLKSRVVYTIGHDVCVEVACLVIQPKKKHTFRANRILVIYDTGGENPEVVPSSFHEAEGKLDAIEQYKGSFGE